MYIHVLVCVCVTVCAFDVLRTDAVDFHGLYGTEMKGTYPSLDGFSRLLQSVWKPQSRRQTALAQSDILRNALQTVNE